MSLSIIIPTLGRPTLQRTLESIVHQLDAGDEAIIVTDGTTNAQIMLYDLSRIHWVVGPRTGCWGNAQRDKGMEIATGTHLMFIDDDDVYEPGALELVRQAITAAPAVAHIFRIRFGPGHPAGPLGGQLGPIWETETLSSQNIGTPMVVLPNVPPMPRWADGDDADMLSDFVFLRRAIPRFGFPVWHPEVIATVRP